MESKDLEFEKDYPIIPDGYELCWVDKLDDNQFQIPKTYLIYEDDSICISELIEQYIKNTRIQAQLKKKRKFLYFSFGKNKLDILQSLSLKQIKAKLNNFTIKTFHLNPYLISNGQMIPECSRDHQISEDQNFKDYRNEANKIEVSLVFPQIQNHFYNTKFRAYNTLQKALRQFMKDNANEITHNLQRYKMKVKCLTCNDNTQIKVQKDVKDVVSDSHSLEVTFDQFGRAIDWREFIQVEIRFHDLQDRECKKFSYEKIKEYKIKNIVKFINSKENRLFGLRILGNVLKPEQKLSTAHSHIILKENQTVDAYLVLESQFFYNALPFFKDHTFLLEKEETKKKLSYWQRSKVQNLYNARETRLSQIDTSIHRDAAFFDPIFGYTSNLFYKELNEFLRQLNFPSIDESNYLQDWFLKFTYSLITSLFRLPSFDGLVYRGQRIFDQTSKVGQVICFKNFTSSSISRNKAEYFGRNTIYTIRSLSGKSIGEFSYFKKEQEVLFLPHSYFKVIKIDRTTESYQIELEELPSPRKRDENLLLWIDDHTTEGNRIYNTFFTRYPLIKTELIQLLSNDQLELWLKYFGFHLLNPCIKISAITDMKRGTQFQAGINTIKMLRKMLPKMDILVFVGDEARTKEVLEKNRMNLDEHLKVGNQNNVAREFIKSKVLRLQQTKEDECQLI